MKDHKPQTLKKNVVVPFWISWIDSSLMHVGPRSLLATSPFYSFSWYLAYIYKLSKTWEITYYTSITLFLWLFYVSILHML